MTRIVIIDPIFRGSRLFYTQLVSELGDNVSIITRTNSRTPEYDIAFTNKTPFIYEAVGTKKDDWYYHLNDTQISQLTNGIASCLEKSPSPDIFFMAGLDELGPQFANILKIFSQELANTFVIGVHYTPRTERRRRIGPFHLPGALGKPRLAGNFARIAAGLETLRASAIPNLRLAVLDERIKAQVAGSELFMLLPDPPPPAPEPSSQMLDAARMDGGSSSFLLVGRQSQRKGFADIQAMFERHSTVLPDEARFVLCGQLEPEMEGARKFIASRKDRIVHIDRYLSEEEIRARYLAADYVVLPYTPGFTGSSGVLASAASAGKPVIATDHGLIGHRILAHRLGFVYPSGNSRALANIVRSLPKPASSEYRVLQENCLDFARRNSTEAFQAKIRQAMQGRYD